MKDILIVGGGVAGLTAAAYLARSGRSVVVCEKEAKVGGLVNSFEFKGFVFDGGIRAMENSGIVFPMLRQLGLDVEFVWNPVSIGIEDDIVRLSGKESLEAYQGLLERHFPDRKDDIAGILSEIRKIMHYMDILYGIDNPLFLDMKENAEYFRKTILPWIFQYMATVGKIGRLAAPVEEHLRGFTGDPVLIDLIAQHFFKKTPAFFALSYFSLYLDYQYPKGGTGVFVDRLLEFIQAHGGEILTETRIRAVDPERRQALDERGNAYDYRQMIWAADLKTLYAILDIDALKNPRDRRAVAARKSLLSDKVGGDSVLTLYLTVDLDRSYFEERHSAHFFYTPRCVGVSGIGAWSADRETLLSWIGQFLDRTTYEISVPALRDPSLVPEGRTGLIVSTLLDHSLVKQVDEGGWFPEFRSFCEERIVSVLEGSIYPGIRAKILDRFLSTPLTLQRRTGNSDGAITGWAFTNSVVPSETRLPLIARSVLTPVPDVLQAGQWTFSPSGLPISILTGKLAADAASKRLKRRAR